MKKKILVLLVLFIALIITGCSKKDNPKKDELANDEVILENIKYKLDQDTSEYGLNFKIAENFRKRDTGNAINYFSEEIDGSSYFVIRIFRYKNKDINYAIKDTTSSYDKKYEKQIGDKTYTVVHFVNPIGNNVETELFYYTSNKTTYAYCFTANASLDLTRLQEIFLNNIVY